MSVQDLVESSLNKAHLEDRKATAILAKIEPNTSQAIECHQKAHVYLRKTYFELMQNSDVKRDITAYEKVLTSIWCQMDYHSRHQSVLLNKLKHEIMETKRQKYIASLQEKHAEQILKLMFPNHTKIQQKLSQSEDLLENLRETFDNEANTVESGKSVIGRKVPKSTQDTIEELRSVNEQLKIFVNGLMDENIKLRDESVLLQKQLQEANEIHMEEDNFSKPDCVVSINSENLHKSQKTSDGASPADANTKSVSLELPPLTEPPSIEFDLDWDSGQMGSTSDITGDTMSEKRSDIAGDITDH